MTIEEIIDAGYARCGAEIAYGYLAAMDADGCIRIFECIDEGYALAELIHRNGDLVVALELWARPWTVSVTDSEGSIIEGYAEQHVFASREDAAQWLSDKHTELAPDAADAVTAQTILASGRIPSPLDDQQCWAICRREAATLEYFGAYEATAQQALKS